MITNIHFENKKSEGLTRIKNSLNQITNGNDNNSFTSNLNPIIGFWEKNFVTNKVFHSEELSKIFGLNTKKKSVIRDQIYSKIHPDDVVKLKKAYSDSLKSKSGYQVFVRVPNKNGNEKIICEKGINEFDSNGKLIRSIGIVQDVTESKRKEEEFKESEEKFRTFFEFNKLPMLQINYENKKIINCNNAAVNYYGYSKEELLSKKIYDINTMSRQEIDKLMKNAIEKSIQKFRFKHRLANGEIKDVEVFASLINLKHKYNLFIIVNDVTNQVKAEKELVELNENKNKLFSIIAHDLRSPFMALSGISQMISEDMDSMSVKEVKNMASMLYNSTQNLYKLMENLLQWANLQMDTLEVSPVLFDIKEVSKQVNKAFQLASEEKNITIINNIRKTNVFADVGCVKAILRNLINNALKFSNKGDEIVLSSKVEKGMVKIIVKDNGIGMSKETLNKLFSIKNKVSKKGTANEVGTGLGLILCKELVEKNHGEIFVKSKPGKGSEFSFTLPHFANK